MSEYQYYEFQAIDRPLTEEEQRAVSRLSSRVDPHPRQAVFVYHYSDFQVLLNEDAYRGGRRGDSTIAWPAILS